ncbi:MAG: nitrilase-related carbon-nitrogen hydrolase [Pseudomonadota bacterium]
MKAGFIQFDPLFGNVKDNIEKAIQLIESLDADIIVLPEFFNTGYLFTSKQEAKDLAEIIPGGPTTEALCNIARKKNLYLVGGLVEQAGDRLYNAAILVSPQGHVATYRKVHLFNEETLWFTPGDRGFEVYDIGLCKLGIMICFDWIFPEAMRVLALKGADLICHPANLVLSFCQDAMITRCLENRVFAVTSNRTGTEQRGGKTFCYTGRSQITGPVANILYRAGADTEETGVVNIDVSSARNKRLNPFNDLFEGRRVPYYGALTGQVA